MSGSFALALQRLGPAPIDPRTGEILDLPECDHEDLVGAFVALNEYEKQLKAWRTQVEDELVRRHGDRRAAQTVGANEVDVDRGFSRAWDIDDLMAAVADLIDRGLLDPRVTTTLIREKREVNGVEAKKLIDHAEPDVLVELSRCFTWKAGRARVKVTPVVEIEQGSAA